MVFFPNCKINLGLRILRKREDGFHDLETIFYPLPVRDVLETIRDRELRFTPYGLPIPGESSQNLCIKAFELLKKDFPDLPFVHIHLYKRIPIGAGLGGGSSDGAAMLRLLNSQFRLGLSPDRLQQYALQLGSDCPFFLLNEPCLGTGRGEKLQPLELDLSSYSILIIHPCVHISTAKAFSLCTPEPGGESLATLIRRPVTRWAAELVNDFEKPVFSEHPVLHQIKQEMYARGAIYASLTGSGSSLFGIFGKDKADPSGWDPAYEVVVPQ